MARRIDQVEGPAVVGRRYWVPCRQNQFRAGWWPVIGPDHDDAEYIGVAQRHWHYDARFLTDSQLRDLMPREDPRPAAAMTRLFMVENAEGGVRYRRLYCRRPMPDFPLEVIERRRATGVVEPIPSPFAAKLEAAYAGVRLKPGCRTCPHRGVPLTGLEARDGVVVCPGHGLAWNLATGEMVPRERKEAARGHV